MEVPPPADGELTGAQLLEKVADEYLAGQLTNYVRLAPAQRERLREYLSGRDAATIRASLLGTSLRDDSAAVANKRRARLPFLHFAMTTWGEQADDKLAAVEAFDASGSIEKLRDCKLADLEQVLQLAQPHESRVRLREAWYAGQAVDTEAARLHRLFPLAPQPLHFHAMVLAGVRIEIRPGLAIGEKSEFDVRTMIDLRSALGERSVTVSTDGDHPTWENLENKWQVMHGSLFVGEVVSSTSVYAGGEQMDPGTSVDRDLALRVVDKISADQSLIADIRRWVDIKRLNAVVSRPGVWLLTHGGAYAEITFGRSEPYEKGKKGFHGYVPMAPFCQSTTMDVGQRVAHASHGFPAPEVDLSEQAHATRLQSALSGDVYRLRVGGH